MTSAPVSLSLLWGASAAAFWRGKEMRSDFDFFFFFFLLRRRFFSHSSFLFFFHFFLLCFSVFHLKTRHETERWPTRRSMPTAGESWTQPARRREGPKKWLRMLAARFVGVKEQAAAALPSSVSLPSFFSLVWLTQFQILSLTITSTPATTPSTTRRLRT